MGWRHERGGARLAGYGAIASGQQHVADRFHLSFGPDRLAHVGGTHHRLGLLACKDRAEGKPVVSGGGLRLSYHRWIGLFQALSGDLNFKLSHYRNEAAKDLSFTKKLSGWRQFTK